MYSSCQNGFKIIGVLILSALLGACGGGASSEVAGSDIPTSPVFELPTAPVVVPDEPTIIPDEPPTNTIPSDDPIPTNPSPSNLASRTQGVAPLAVFFDAINVPGVTQPPEINGRREYADFQYSWNFDDPTSGTWAISGKSKNQADGYVAAHVFETPGTYSVTLHVTDGASVDEWHQVDIIVEDPDTIYAGTATTCVSSTGNFTGCPSGAKQVTTSEFSKVGRYMRSGRRILFRRGDSWTTKDVIRLWNNPGPLTIGAYGTCTSPDERGICANAPLIYVKDKKKVVEGLFHYQNLSDSRLMDIHFVDADARRSVAGGNTGLNAILHLRLQSEGFDTPFGSGNWNTGGHDQLAYFDNDFSVSRTNILFTGSERLMILGNRLRDPGLSHVLRVWHAYKGVIAHNETSGSSSTSSSGRHALKLHGPTEDQIAGSGGSALDNRTRYVIVADNLVGGSGPWPFGIGPQDNWQNELIQDIVVENNRFYPGWGTQSCCSLAVQEALNVWASYVTVRNNIFSGEGSSNYFTAVKISRRGIEPVPRGNRVFNNTIYKSDSAGTGYWGVVISADARDSRVQNNLAHLNPNVAVTLIENAGTNTVASNNLLTNTPGLIDPDNPNFMAKDFRLQAGSPAIDAGTNVPVFRDMASGSRPQGGGYELGAHEHQ